MTDPTPQHPADTSAEADEIRSLSDDELLAHINRREIEATLRALTAERYALQERAEQADSALASAIAWAADRLEAATRAEQAKQNALREQAKQAEAEVARLRHEITEASDPDFLWGAMDNVADQDVTLGDYAAAASRAIRAAIAAFQETEQ